METVYAAVLSVSVKHRPVMLGGTSLMAWSFASQILYPTHRFFPLKSNAMMDAIFTLLYFSTAFYALSLIAQTPAGAMSLKEFGWETYRVRSHSIPPSVANTDGDHNADRRISKVELSASLPRKSVSVQVTPPVPTVIPPPNPLSKRDLTQPLTVDVLSSIRFNFEQESTGSDLKSKRSLTMPSSILLNTADKSDVRSGNERHSAVADDQRHACRSSLL